MPSGIYKRKPLSEETKRKISLANTGKKRTKEFCKNQSILFKGKIPWNKGLIGYRKGYKMSNEEKLKHSISMIKSYDIKGRKIYKRPKHQGHRYKDWRKSVFERDNYTCMKCNIKNGLGKTIYIEAHHIKSWVNYHELRYELSNGITLCKPCHVIENKITRKTESHLKVKI